MLETLRKIIPLDGAIRRTYHYIRGVFAFRTSGNPAKDMIIIGVTGTKWKTTTTNLIARGLQAAGHKVAMFSTANMSINGEVVANDMKMTTPSPFYLWNFIAQAKKAGCNYLVLETSSHALYYHRVHGLQYDVAVLTNIAQDHLDLHKTMRNYVETKLELFKNLYKYGMKKGVRKVSVVNIDHEYASEFLSKEIVTDNLYTTGFSSAAGVRAENISHTTDGTTFQVRIPSNVFSLKTQLFGDFNIANILSAVAVLMSQKVDIEKIQKIVAEFDSVPGRLEEVPNTRGAKIFVDYAHTEDSLKNVISTVKNIDGVKRTIVVFGATGDRDKSKRPKMGRVADTLADVVLLTDDDTYTEDSLSIIRQVTEGIKRKEWNNFWIIPNREDAIRTALIMLRAGDALIIAGKGAEMEQVTQKGRIPWNDRKFTEAILKQIDTQILQ